MGMDFDLKKKLPVTASTSICVFKTVMESKANKFGFIGYILSSESIDRRVVLVDLELGNLLRYLITVKITCH